MNVTHFLPNYFPGPLTHVPTIIRHKEFKNGILNTKFKSQIEIHANKTNKNQLTNNFCLSCQVYEEHVMSTEGTKASNVNATLSLPNYFPDPLTHVPNSNMSYELENDILDANPDKNPR